MDALRAVVAAEAKRRGWQLSGEGRRCSDDPSPSLTRLRHEVFTGPRW